MRTEDLLEQCLQALSTGQEIPPEVARYLARHPEKRVEVEELIFIAQRASGLPNAALPTARRAAMQNRLADKLGFDPAALNPPARINPVDAEQEELAQLTDRQAKKKPLLSVGRLSLARLQYQPPITHRDHKASARIRGAFRDLTPEDIRRYIGPRGEDYLYYRQDFPGWEPVFALLAFVLRGFKRLEKLTGF